MKSVLFKKVIIQNFLSIGNTPIVIDFQKGINIITGTNIDKPERVNAVGKSSIADAIYFGIFGDTLREIKKDLIVNNITGGTAYVELDVDVVVNDQKQSYQIIRTINPSKVTVTCNDIDITRDSAANTNKLICEILSTTPAIFQNCVIMTVNNAIPFMAKSKIDKRKFIEDIFGLEIFSDMLSVVRSRYNDVKKQADIEAVKKDEVQTSLLNYKKQREKTIEYRKQKLSTYLERQQNNTKDKQALLESIKNIEIPDIKEIEAKNVKLNNALNLCDTKMSDSLLQISEIKASNKVLQEKYDTIGTSSASCPVCLRSITEQDANHIKIEKKNIISTIEENKSKINTVIKELERIKDKKNLIQTNIQSNDRLINSKSLVDQKIKNIHEKIEQIDKWQESLIQDIEYMSQTNTEFDDTINETEQQIAKINNLYQDLTSNLNILDVSKFVLSEEGVKSFIVKKLLEILNTKLIYYLKKLDCNAICMFNEFFEEEIVNDKNKICSYFNFSGAERKSIDLACLFTFSDLRRMQGGVSYNIAIYDELFDSSFDSKGIDLIVELLRERIHKFDEAVYVISHRKESIKNVTGDVVYLEKRNGITKRIPYV